MHNVKLFHFILVALAGWVNRHQQAIIDYLIEENRVFKQQLHGRRLRLSDNDRRRLAVKAKMLGRSVLDEITNLVTVGRHYSSKHWSRHNVGRPHATRIGDEVHRRGAMRRPWRSAKVAA